MLDVPTADSTVNGMKISRNALIIVAVSTALVGTLATQLTGGHSHETKPSASTSGKATDKAAITCEPHAHAHGAGTSATAEGYTLKVLNTTATAGADETLQLTINDAESKRVSEFQVKHTKQMHLVAVRDDLGAYLHIHPVVNADGVWETPVNFPTGGNWRIIADVVTTDDLSLNLGSTLKVNGPADKFTLPAATASLSVDGFDINIGGEISTDEHGMLLMTITKDGAPVKLDEFLGAGAHLVAIRTDGSYSHFHPHSMTAMTACTNGGMPLTDPEALEEAAKGNLHFMTEVPGSGDYRLFLQFQVDGVIHLAAFTANIA